MVILIVILIILACLLLGFFVLIQESKGGGLASSFASSNQVMGVKKTASFLEKATWVLMALIMVLCLTSAFMTKSEMQVTAPAATEQTAETPVE